VRIEFDSLTNSVSVDGARFSLDVLATLANPNLDRFYRFVRVGDTVFLQSYEKAEDAELYASGIGGIR
jgi:hypothetical protein